MNNINILSKISNILEIEVIRPIAKNRLAKNNAKQIILYKITYLSQGHKVIGFIAEPKRGDTLPCIIYNRGGDIKLGVIKAENLFFNSVSDICKAGYIVITTQHSGAGGSE